MPPACPRRHDHTTHTSLVHTRHTPLAPCAPRGRAACVPSATRPHGTNTPLVNTRHTTLAPCAPCGRAACVPSATRPHGTHSARSTSPPPLRLHRRVCCPLRWAQIRRGFASLPRLLENRFSLGATHPAHIVYRLAPSPCGMTAASHSRLLGRGFPEPPPSLVAAWLALSPCGLVGLLLLLVCGRRFASWRNPRRRPPVAGSAPFPQTRRLGPRSPPFATLRPRRGRRGQGT